MSIWVRKKMPILSYFMVFVLIMNGLWITLELPQPAWAANDGAMMVYAQGTTLTPYYRTWDESIDTWGAEGTATAVSGTIQFMVLRFSRTRNEAILGTLDSTGDIRTQVWSGSTWSATTLHANVSTTNDIYRGFDIAYETSGDRAIIVFNNANSADPAYQIWGGLSWSVKISITDPATTGAPLWIELASNPLSASNEIAMMFIDANVDVYGMVWTGSAWSQMGAGTAAWDATGSIATKESIDVAYEQTSGRAMFIWGDSVATDQYYRIWNGTSLTAATLLDIAASGGIGEWVRLVPRPNSNELMYGVQDAGVDLNTRKWDGSSAWDTATQHPEHDASVEQITTRNFDIAWETYSGNAGKAWLLYCDSATVSHKQWSGTAWGTATTNGDDTAWIRLEAQPSSGSFFGMIFQDLSSGNDDILEEHLVSGGTTWSALFTVWGGAVVEVTYEPLDIAMMRYVPSLTYTPQMNNWRWYADEGDETPGTGYATETTGTSPQQPLAVEMGQRIPLKLRINITETAGVGENDSRKKLQWSTDQSAWTDVPEASLPSPTQPFVYTTDVSGGDDNVVVTTQLLTGTTQSGIHNESNSNSPSNSDHTASATLELEYAFEIYTGATISTAYYFQLYDQVLAAAIPLASGKCRPKLTTAAAFVLSLLGPTDIAFGDFTLGNPPPHSHKFTADEKLTMRDNRGVIGDGWTLTADITTLQSGSYQIQDSSVYWISYTTDVTPLYDAPTTGISGNTGSYMNGAVTVTSFSAANRNGHGGFEVLPEVRIYNMLYAGDYTGDLIFTLA